MRIGGGGWFWGGPGFGIYTRGRLHCLGVALVTLPGWRNRQTQRTQNPPPSKGVWVRPPPRAPWVRQVKKGFSCRILDTKPTLMRTAKVKGTGGKYHLELSEGSCSVRIYSSAQQKQGRTYQTHFLTYFEGGERKRVGYAKLDDAKAQAELVLLRLINGETKASGMKAVDVQATALAIEELAPLGTTVLAAVREYRQAIEKLGGKGTLLEAVDHFVKNARPDLPVKKVPEVQAELLLAKKADGRAHAYLRDLKLRTKRFSEAFKGPIAGIRTSDIETWLRGLGTGAKNRNNYATAVTTLFNFAKRAGYLPSDRATAAEDLSRAKDVGGDIEIYSPKEMGLILERARQFRADLLPYAAIGGFAGIRPAEILRLDWREIDFDSALIEVKASKSKTAGRRHVPISKNLAAWLEPLRKTAGPVCSEARAQEQLKLIVEKTVVRDDAVEPGIAWKPNALRHSFGSYRLPIIKSAAELALEMGNSPAMVFRHYRELVKPAQAEEFWSIMPPPGWHPPKST